MIECKLVGITFENEDGTKRSDICNTLKEGQAVDLNSTVAKWKDRKAGKPKEDKFAVEVLSDGQVCGMIPASINQNVHSNVKQARVIRFTRNDGMGFTDDENAPIVSVTIELDIDAPKVAQGKPLEDAVMLQSFNEPQVVVEFYPVAHQYWIGDVRLESVTGVKDTMYKPFDAKFMSGRCENSYGLAKDEIADMWSLNGDCASSFGTGMHGYMEIHQNYRSRINPDKIVKTLPKIPLLRDIVTSFAWTDDLVHTEVLVTDVKAGMCGLVYRDVEISDVHRIEDYKFQAEWDVKDSRNKNLLLPELPQTKLAKCLVQESIYADMMVRSGMTVDDEVVAHIWDGEWHHIEMARIKGIIDIILEARKGDA